jgi:Fe-S-cluster containining protein
LSTDPILNATTIGHHTVPGLWRYILPEEIFNFQVPDEREATCMNCPQIAKESYNRTYRCCTYNPAVPNYSLGLAMRTPMARTRISRLIEEGWALPEGSVQTPVQWQSYLEVSKEDTFGQTEKTRCDLLDKKNGFCTIYAFRNAICSTFFCIHDHGKKGERFWESVQELVGQIESALTYWSMEQAGLCPKSYNDRMNELASDVRSLSDGNGRWTKKAREYLFAGFYGQELAFFDRCAEAVSQNRDKLWDIANSQQIYSPEKFDKAQLAMIPKSLKTEIDPEDYEDGEALTPKAMWRSLRGRYHKLFSNVQGRLILNPKVDFFDNDFDGAEENHYADRAVIMSFLTRKGSAKYDWQLFVDKSTKKLLTEFTKPQRPTPQHLRRFQRCKFGKLDEWLAKKVLIEAKA